MQNAHLRLGRLEYIKPAVSPKSTPTHVTVAMDRLIVEPASDENQAPRCHLLSVFGGEQEIAAIHAAIAEQANFRIAGPDLSPMLISLGERAHTFRGLIQAPGRRQSGRAESSSGDPPVPETPGGIGQVLDAPNPDDPGAPATSEHLREQEREWRVAVQQAYNAAKIAGKCPAGVDRALEFSEEASVDWREALRRCFSETLLVDYTWSRPNRRFVGSELYLPGPKKEGAGEVAIAVDCSGSIDNRTLSLFAAEFESLIEESHPERVHVLYFDTQVQRADVFEFGQPLELAPKGGGGTDFRPVFSYLEDEGIEPHAVVFLTDLCGRFPQQEPRWPVIWASTEKREAPFGATVYMGAA